MAAPIPTTEPTIITPGDTVKWKKSLPDYPVTDGWDLSYELINSGQRIVINASGSGADHLVVIAATASIAYAPGIYDWRARASKSGETYTVGTGRCTIAQGFGAVSDARSQARRTLEAIDATLEGRATSATEMYEIQTPGGGMRKLKHVPIQELLVLRDRYRADVAREDAAARSAAGLPNPGRIFVRHISS